MDYIIAIIPSVCAGVILYLILRWITRADRTERTVQREMQDDAAQWYENVKNAEGTRNPFGKEADESSKEENILNNLKK